jgi:hypothetical protein
LPADIDEYRNTSTTNESATIGYSLYGLKAYDFLKRFDMVNVGHPINQWQQGFLTCTIFQGGKN